MRLVRRPRPFDHPDWIFELKLDGFRALAHFENGRCELVSRKKNTFASFRKLAADIAGHFKGKNGILDGEIVSMDANGYPQFEDLMFRRGELFFVAFDALYLDGEDLRGLPLIERKTHLQAVVPSRRAKSRLRYHSHVRKRGRLEKISDDELERELIAGNHMCEPSSRPVRECYRIQRELARLEICRRGSRREYLLASE
jgi:ATP-dependent DNA ligase